MGDPFLDAFRPVRICLVVYLLHGLNPRVDFLPRRLCTKSWVRNFGVTAAALIASTNSKIAAESFLELRHNTSVVAALIVLHRRSFLFRQEVEEARPSFQMLAARLPSAW